MYPDNSLKLFKKTFVLVSIISGCHRGARLPTFYVKVDSIRDVSAPDIRNYIILPGKEGIDNNDLYFKEYSRYIIKALDKQGYSFAKKAEKANIVILLNYGIGEPEKLNLC